MAMSAAYCSGLGKLGTLVGRASETICASIGTARRSALRRLASKRACRRSSSARFDLAVASSWRSCTSSSPVPTTCFFICSRLWRTDASREAAIDALFSMPSTILPTSLLICRCRPSRSARNCRMRGCAGSSVADSSESWRSTRTRCCTRFWISGERCTSGSDSEVPVRTISRTDWARASASLRAACARVSSEVMSPSCCWLRPVLLGPPLKMLACPRKCSTAASASATSFSSLSIFGCSAFCTSSVCVRLRVASRVR